MTVWLGQAPDGMIGEQIDGLVEYGDGRRASSRGEAVVADAMIRRPKLCPSVVTVAEVRRLFDDDHVHLALVVDEGRLVTVLERADLAGKEQSARPASNLGSLAGRTVPPGGDLWATWAQMKAEGRRRLAVVDADGRVAGLLCLKRSGRGFCSESGMSARAAERAQWRGSSSMDRDV